MVFTKTEVAARFALQMAEQSRRFGARVAELRSEHHLEQKDLVARMVNLGDKGINTNQVSRYEGGEGPMPRESRLEAFAEALETSVCDLLAGPVADRAPKAAGDLSTLDGMAASDVQKISKQLDRIEAANDGEEGLRAELRTGLRSLRLELLAEIGKVRTAQEALLRRLPPDGRGEEETGS